MDLDIIRKKLDNLQSKNTPSGKTDYSKIYWKPSIGKQQIRIVPSTYNSNNPFTELKLHYGVGPNKIMISPLNFGERDPIFELIWPKRCVSYSSRVQLSVIYQSNTRLTKVYWPNGL